MTGRRVLAVDLDQQALLSALHGFQPELDANRSLYDAIRYDEKRRPILDVIVPTNFPLKLSGGTVVHGYEKQLEFYRDASQTEFALFVVIDYGDLGTKLNEIQLIRSTRLDAGKRAPEIIVIDATRKASASKRY